MYPYRIKLWHGLFQEGQEKFPAHINIIESEIDLRTEPDRIKEIEVAGMKAAQEVGHSYPRSLSVTVEQLEEDDPSWQALKNQNQ